MASESEEVDQDQKAESETEKKAEAKQQSPLKAQPVKRTQAPQQKKEPEKIKEEVASEVTISQQQIKDILIENQKEVTSVKNDLVERIAGIEEALQGNIK